MIKLLHLFLSAVVLVFLFVGFQPAEVLANHSWNGYHWSHASRPVTIRMGDNVSSSWKPYLYGAASAWDRSSVLVVPVVGGNSVPSTCPMRAGSVQVCNASYGATGWLGLAQISINGKHITQGTVKLNDSYFSQARFNNAPWKNLVTCQEIGHTLGLNHQDENFNNAPLGTCMDYSNDPTPNQRPNLHDYIELQSVYWHLDSATSLQSDTSVASDMAVQDFSNRSAWGTLTGGSDRQTASDTSLASDAKTSYGIYERDLGAGKKLQTVVMWVQ
jgi:hypothetical protein